MHFPKKMILMLGISLLVVLLLSCGGGITYFRVTIFNPEDRVIADFTATLFVGTNDDPGSAFGTIPGTLERTFTLKPGAVIRLRVLGEWVNFHIEGIGACISLHEVQGNVRIIIGCP